MIKYKKYNINGHSVADKRTGFARRQRTSDIYTRFINRVRQIEGDTHNRIQEIGLNSSDNGFRGDLEGKDMHDTDTGASTGCQTTGAKDPSINNKNADIEHSFKDSRVEIGRNDDAAWSPASLTSELKPQLNPEIQPEYHPNPAQIPVVANEPANIVLAQKPTSALKLLAAGVIGGILLSLAMIVILNKTNLLSPLIPTAIAPTAPPSMKSSNPVAEKQTQAILTPESADTQPLDTAVATQSSSAPAESVSPTTVSQQSVNQLDKEETQPKVSPDAAISIADFHAESQSTLYRETTE